MICIRISPFFGVDTVRRLILYFICVVFLLGGLQTKILAVVKNPSLKIHKSQNDSSSQKNSLKCFYIRKYNKRNHRHYYVRHCQKTETFDERVDAFLSSLTPDQHSALQKKLKQQKALEKTQYGISFYEPTYILPFYYTGDPYQAVYKGNTPDNQKVDNEELKAQVSLVLPLWTNIFHSHYALNISYTQLSYWQFYAKSQYFRETDYEPAIFVSNHFLPNWLASVGIVHQSNGRGGQLERSWNRLYFEVSFSGPHWLISVKPWILIFKSESSDLHNPNIANYLGYGRVVLAYQFGRQEVSVMFRNVLESGFSRGAEEVDYQFPIYGKVSGYIQFFSGYGQSLIEYDHYTNSVGVGIILSNWI